ncbi:hypothetical protein TA3x_003901 [Tundrisphaera sp. TA3]|uniref:hypothetical protein n=1 Tax=Tundrisphaera sp. TA3 TaxID=3435775 RepID=UPI003EBFA6B3
MTARTRGVVRQAHRAWISRRLRRGDEARTAGISAGTIALGVAVGLQSMLAAMLLVARTLEPAAFAELTARGRDLFRPEYDLPLYAAGCLAGLALAFGLARFRRDAGNARPALLAVLATAAFLASLSRVPPTPDPMSPWRAASLVAPGALAVAAFLAGGRRGPAARGLFHGRARRWRDQGVEPSGDGGPAPLAPWRRVVADASAVGLIILLVAVPSSSRLAGRIAALESIPFHHWDFFVMGPTLRYLHGGALGTEVYSQYGVAWPVLFAGLSPWLPVTYGNVLAVTLSCGILYFVGVFLGLRLFLKNTAWAAAGAVLAIYVQMHIGVFPRMTIWLTPSSSVLRAPMDVWFFLALGLHLDSGRRRWIALAGMLVGLSILFETDTGLYLAATLGLALACLPGCPSAFPEIGSRVGAVRAFFGRCVLAGGAMAATLLAGLAIASRGTLLRREFWMGWLEPLRLYGGGVSALPIRAIDGLTGPIVFLAMAGTYLTLVGLMLAALPGRRASRGLVLGGCVSAYGLCQLLQYVNRSHPFNLYHAGVPFCVIAVGLVALAVGRWSGRASIAAWSPRLALGLALLVLVTGSGFRAYPHPWDRLVDKPQARGLTLMADVKGLPDARRGEVDEFRAVVRRMKRMRAQGTTVAVLDPADTRFYLASGCPPWDRYTSLVTQVLRKDQLAEAEERLSAAGVDVWIAREPRPKPANWNDAHLALLARIGRDYVLEEKVGRYGIWRARRPPSTRTADAAGRTASLTR